VATIEQSSRALLSIRLGPVAIAPPKILRVFACDDAIDVASPILTQAENLDSETLIECARTKNQEHLLAISGRKALPEALTEVLVERGDQQVVLTTAKNKGAKFSVKGFDTLHQALPGRRCANETCVGLRPDLPPQLFDRLLTAASAKVRAALEAERDLQNPTSTVSSTKSQAASRLSSQLNR
jgi:uncharacterized protein (DUF2336 family)